MSPFLQNTPARSVTSGVNSPFSSTNCTNGKSLSFPTLDGVRGKVVYKKDFPLDLSDDGESVFIGSIAVCVERAEEQAIEYGHSLTRELTYLICHGLLHLMGYDHIENDDKIEMRALEDKIMNKIKVLR